jgi:fatty-acyl-CoA synthase
MFRVSEVSVSTDLSYVEGERDIPLSDLTIGEKFRETCQKYPERLALVVRHQDIRWTYQDLQNEVDQIAKGFLALGLKVGDRVGIWSPNTLEWVLTQLATAKVGLILVTLNPAYRTSEIECALHKSGCRAVVLAERFKTSDYVGMIQKILPNLGTVGFDQQASKLPALEFPIVVSENPPTGFMAFEELKTKAAAIEDEDLNHVADSLSADDAINIQFTSGTTGFPKGATLSHRNILNNGYFTVQRQNMTEQDRLCLPVPLYHCFGMVMGVLGAISVGAAIIFPAEAFEPATVLQTVEDEKCTVLYGVPTMFIGELEHPDFQSYDVSSLRTGVMAGSPCPIEIMKRVISDMHMDEVTIAYGMTETSPVSFQSKITDSVEKRVSTVGQIHPHVEVKIVDPDGDTVGRGVQGELCTRGYSVMKGYWSDEARTREAIDDQGWMYTGDLAVMDGEGYVNITGRVKDMIIRGGENVYPREIEEYLYRMEAVQDVQVFGVPDERFGEEIACWVVAKENTGLSATDIVDFCKGEIAHYKVPRHIRIVDEFPMTVTGKIQKFVMRDIMIKDMNLSEQKTA